MLHDVSFPSRQNLTCASLRQGLPVCIFHARSPRGSMVIWTLATRHVRPSCPSRLLVLFQKSFEEYEVFFLVGQERDANILRDVIVPFGVLDYLLVVLSCRIFCFDDRFDHAYHVGRVVAGLLLIAEL